MEKLQGCVQNVEQSTAWSRKLWEETRTLKRKAEKYHALCNLFEGQVWGFTPQQVWLRRGWTQPPDTLHSRDKGGNLSFVLFSSLQRHMQPAARQG